MKANHDLSTWFSRVVGGGTTRRWSQPRNSRQGRLPLRCSARWVSLAWGLVACGLNGRAELLVYYTFDVAGPRISNHGSLGPTAELRMYDGIGVNAELRTDESGGWRGRALRLAPTHGEFGSFAHSLPLALKLTSGLTITGWVRLNEWRAGAFILRNAHQANGFNLLLGENGALVLSVSGTDVASAAGSFPIQEWIFFAATWSLGREGAGVVAFYRGVSSSDSRLVAVGHGVGGESMGDAGVALILGNSGNKDHPLHGLIDDLRIYNEALDIEQLEAVRKSAAP